MLRLHLRPSVQLASLLALAHGLALALLWPLDLPLWGKLTLAVLIAVSAYVSVGHIALLRADDAVTGLEIRDSGEVFLLTRQGVWHACHIGGDSFVSPWLTIVLLRREDRRRDSRMLVTADNCDAGDFRNLRVWLRWGSKRTPETV